MMEQDIQYTSLQAGDITPALFCDFQRRQKVTHCWRKQDGKWYIRDISFIDDWTADDYRVLVMYLRRTCDQGGVVFGAFCENKLKGFAAVSATLFGQNKEYLDLPSLHVSADMRGRGIGRVLFDKAKGWAGEHGAKKLYISAHSSVESQAFYRAMGCVEAQEYSEAHVRREPFDCQLECRI